MTGKVDGESIVGKAQFGGFGEGDWTAKKVEATTAAAPTPVAAATSPASTPNGISGHWEVTVKTQMGDVPVTADLTDNAGKISGAIVGPTGPVDVSGTLEGSALKLSFTAKTPQGDIPVEMIGEVNGDSIIGKAEFGGMGQGEWTAKRRQ
jgi:hypothetical protein